MIFSAKAKSPVAKKTNLDQQSYLFLTVDDVVVEIKVNGKSQDVKPLQGDPKIWGQMKKYPIDFEEGDIVSISGKNNGGPAGILASLQWTNKFGIRQTFWTGSSWTCGTVHPPVNFGHNGVSPWNNIAGIDSRAQWIWDSNKRVEGDETTCTGRIPKSHNAVINVTVANYLENITVNGKPLRIESMANLLDWSKMKEVHTMLNKGDELEIYGSNVSGPAGILATIQYSQGGKMRTFQTGRGWTCNKVPAVLLARNKGSPTWGTVDGIHNSSSWIWNSHQQINNDMVSCKVTVGDVKETINRHHHHNAEF